MSLATDVMTQDEINALFSKAYKGKIDKSIERNRAIGTVNRELIDNVSDEEIAALGSIKQYEIGDRKMGFFATILKKISKFFYLLTKTYKRRRALGGSRVSSIFKNANGQFEVWRARN